LRNVRQSSVQHIASFFLLQAGFSGPQKCCFQCSSIVFEVYTFAATVESIDHHPHTALKMIDYYERRVNNTSVEFVRQAAHVLGVSVI
jgi:hypothetical protein